MGLCASLVPPRVNFLTYATTSFTLAIKNPMCIHDEGGSELTNFLRDGVYAERRRSSAKNQAAVKT